MRLIFLIGMALAAAGLLAGSARAETFETTDGQTLTGDPVSYNESGLVIRLPGDRYSDRLPWAKFTQDTLKKLKQTPRMAPLVEPFIDEPIESKPKPKEEIALKTPPRLPRPQPHSLFGAMLSSSVGLFMCVLIYGATIYAGYEVARFRGQPKALVCGLAAIPVLGVFSPIVFLSLPTRVEEKVEVAPEVAAAAAQTFSVPGAPSHQTSPVAAVPGSLRLNTAEAGGSTSSLPTTQVFARGAFTFNRRFFETKFPGFFGIVRRDAEKDMVLLVKSVRGEFVAQRITRITANDLHLLVQKGTATQEIAFTFSEIQEVHLKHKDA